MAGFLPSLATLGLGAPTDGNAEGKRPMGSGGGSGGGGGDNAPPAKAARVNDADWMEDDDSDEQPDSPLRPGSRWVAPPPPLSLRGMPPAVIAILVGQAALSARKARFVAREVCRWMRNFCEVAASSGVPCDDDWFRLALGAFGSVPEAPVGPMVFPDRDGKTQSGYVDVRGNEVDAPAPSAPPAPSGFGTWRQLFGQLCVAFDGPEARRGRTREEIAAGVPPSFWDDVSMALYGQRPPPRTVYALQYAHAGLNQRRLDELLDALLARLLPSAAEGPFVSAQARAQLTEQWAAWLRNDAPTADWQSEVGPWKALLTLLLLRGAHPFKSDLYRRLDRDLYTVITRAMHSNYQWKAVLAGVRDAIDAGADPNFDGSDMKDAGLPAPHHTATPFNPQGDPDWPPVLNVALLSGNVDLVKLLVDAGAVYTRGRRRDLDKFWDALKHYLKKLGAKVLRMPEGQEKRDIQDTTMKVLEMLERVCSVMAREGVAHMDAQLEHWLNHNTAGKHFTPAWVRQAIMRIQDMLVEKMRRNGDPLADRYTRR